MTRSPGRTLCPSPKRGRLAACITTGELFMDMDKILESIKRHSDALAEIGKVNKETVFDALRQAHIEKVIVVFDGEGDSGQIESITAYKSDSETPLPTTTVTLKAVDWNGDGQPDTALALPEAVERLCYDFLE